MGKVVITFSIVSRSECSEGSVHLIQQSSSEKEQTDNTSEICLLFSGWKKFTALQNSREFAKLSRTRLNFICHLHAMKPDTLWCFHHCGKQLGSSSIKQRLHVHALEKWNACYIESGVYVCVSLCVYIITFTSPSKKPFSVLGEFKHNDVLISLATTVTLEKLK